MRHDHIPWRNVVLTVPTHLVMASKILAAVQEATGLTLHKRFFFYGNVCPDIARFRVWAPHFASHSMPYVKKRIKALSRHPVSIEGERVDALYSMQLGILCHYICDFFCHVHSTAYEGNFRHHLTYELRQQALIMRHPRLIGRRTTRGALSPVMLSAVYPRDVIEMLERAQQAYLAAPHRADTDLILAVKTASHIAASVLLLSCEHARVPAWQTALA